MNPFVKTFVAAVDLAHRAIVEFTANDGEVTLSTTASGPIAGVVDHPGGAKTGERVDVVLFGPAEVVAGGAILPGRFFVAGAGGKAVAAAPAAGANNVIGGRVLVGAANNDIVKAFINPGSMQGA